MKRCLFAWLIFGCLLAGSCTIFSGNQLNDQHAVPVALQGKFKDDYGSNYSITGKEWIQDGKIKYHLLEYNRKENYFIAQNDIANPFGAGRYTRIDIMYFENMEPWTWGYCLTVFDAPSAREAARSQSADRANPRKGCNGFPFSRMKRD